MISSSFAVSETVATNKKGNHLKNTMKLTNITFLLTFLFLISFSSATLDKHAQNTPYTLTVSSNDATSCTLTYVTQPDGTSAIYNIGMTQSDRTFYTLLSSGNFTQFGNTCIGISCTDGSTTETGSKCLNIGTQSLTEDGITDSSIYIIIGLIVSLFSYLKISKLFGSMGVFILGFGLLFSNPIMGWVAWIVIGIGFTMLITTLMTPKKTKIKMRR